MPLVCLYDVKKLRSELVNQICAWVAVHQMFGGRYVNCEELRADLNSQPVEALQLVVGILYCDGTSNGN